jgi:hypothetical protein
MWFNKKNVSSSQRIDSVCWAQYLSMPSRVVYEKGYELCTTMWERLDADPIPQMLRGRMVGMGMVMLFIIYMQDRLCQQRLYRKIFKLRFN